jgi:hypothetical protein
VFYSLRIVLSYSIVTIKTKQQFIDYISFLFSRHTQHSAISFIRITVGVSKTGLNFLYNHPPPTNKNKHSITEIIIIITLKAGDWIWKLAEEIKWSDETSREKSICTVDGDVVEEGLMQWHDWLRIDGWQITGQLTQQWMN